MPEQEYIKMRILPFSGIFLENSLGGGGGGGGSVFPKIEGGQ